MKGTVNVTCLLASLFSASSTLLVVTHHLSSSLRPANARDVKSSKGIFMAGRSSVNEWVAFLSIFVPSLLWEDIGVLVLNLNQVFCSNVLGWSF